MAALHCIMVMFAFIFNFNEVRGYCLERHKSLLLNFKHSLVIDEFYMSYFEIPSKLANWNSSTDCCLWPGVTCSGMFVTGLDLSDEGIVGGFNDSSRLFDLTGLTSLNLAMMHQDTVIPSGIRNLVNLMNLNMSASNFIGQIPIEVSNLTRLVSLDFSSSYYLKVENPNLGMLVGNLSNLIDLRLVSVDLSSQSREWFQTLSSSTPRLQVLDLNYCGLSGSIHDSRQNLTHLSIVDISYNNFSSPIPYRVLASLKNLTSLRLRNCEFNGVFPFAILQLPTLRFLDISGNGDLEASSSFTFLNSSSLETLQLSGLRISKTIPESIGKAKMLSYLNLSYCNLSGRIPKSIYQLEHLAHLDMSNNNLDDHILSFSRSRNLTVFDLSYNHLHGSILATDWKKLHQMESLILRSNNLSGSIPTSLFETPSLKILNLEGNHFTGFTNETDVKASLSNLAKLSLRGNDLQGPFPPFIYGLSSLQALDLSFNNIKEMFLEEFPPFLSNESTLGSLGLSDKQIDGHIAGQIWNMSALIYLDLSNNQISGHIPDQIWNMSALTYLNLSHNQLEFLAREEHSVRLEILDLSSNKLHGSIPESICNMTDLLILDLSNNSLDGTLPQCWPPELYFLNISKNNINGIIPDTLPFFLRTLDLSQNSFQGTKSLERCTQLEVLDLGYNQLHGMFPCWINNLDQLIVLVLKSNSLYGSIQCLNRDFNLPRLQIIDIASNNFGGNLSSQGDIPREMGELKFLYVLNLSHNHLSGQIPHSFGNLYSSRWTCRKMS